MTHTTTEAQRIANKIYDNANTTQVKLKLNFNTDKDILDRLEDMSKAEGGKQGYIKDLIRRDIAQSGK